MRIAIPTLNGQFNVHFGKMDSLFICDFNPQTCKYSKPHFIGRNNADLRSPGHLLIDHCVNMVLAGGIHCNSITALEYIGIQCRVGMSGSSPEDVLRDYIQQPNRIGKNLCPSADNPSFHCEFAC